MVVEDTSELGNVTIVTNILPATGPVVVNLSTNGKWNGSPAVIINSVYTRCRRCHA
jgi:hypothetical protein